MHKHRGLQVRHKLSDVTVELADVVSNAVGNYNQVTEEYIKGEIIENYQSFIAILYSQFSNQKS